MSPSDVHGNRQPAFADNPTRLGWDESDRNARVVLRLYLVKKRAYHRCFGNGNDAAIREAIEDLRSFLRTCLDFFGGIEPTVSLLHAYAGRDRKLADLVRLLLEDLLEVHRTGLLLSPTADPVVQPDCDNLESARTADAKSASSSSSPAGERRPADSTRVNRPLDSPSKTLPDSGKFAKTHNQTDLAQLLDPSSHFRDRPPPVLAKNAETESAMLAKLQRLCVSLQGGNERELQWQTIRAAIRDFRREFPLFNDDKLSPSADSDASGSNWLYRATDHSWWVRVILNKQPRSFTSYRIITHPTLERSGN
jgi:hypothetical protein